MRTIKRAARHVVDRVLSPHLDAQTAAIAELLSRQPASETSTAAEADPVLTDFNHLLHELRTIALRDVAAAGRTLLSAGCAGAWYFDWVESAAGPVREHIGVELYSPKPDGLASNVRWITASASAMPEVVDSTIDVVFSGQNLEHLWVDDMIGFVLEAWRVLRPGGTLVLDSPNRIVTDAIGWVHPEHTIEITALEAADLLRRAGFDITSMRPLWRCRDRHGQGFLTLVPTPGDVREILDRAVGPIELDDAFVWWIEAQRSQRRPDESAVAETVRRLFDEQWNKRINRAAQHLHAEPDTSGERSVYLTHGFPIFAGSFSVTVDAPEPARVRLLRTDDSEIASGVGTVSGNVDATVFGVRAEVVAPGAPHGQRGAEFVKVQLSPNGQRS